MKKYSFLYIKKHKECNVLIIFRYTKMPYPPKITNETKSGHNFLYPRERRQKNVPVTIVDPLVNTSLMEIFYSFFNILRPSRKPFRNVTLYCKAAVSIELIDIINLVLKYIYVYHLILNIFLEITSKHTCPYYFLKEKFLTRVNREKPIRRRNSFNISCFRLVIFSEARKYNYQPLNLFKIPNNPWFSRT